MAKKAESDLPLLSFGVIADVQYADIDDGSNYSKTRMRYYRNSLSYVKAAVIDWVSRRGTDQQISFVLDLGDLIDGLNAQHRTSESALNTITKVFDPVGVPVFHLWGNHDLYNFSRQQLYAMPKMNPYLVGGLLQPTRNSACSSYFDMELCAGFRLVAIDPYEVSMLGVDDQSESYKSAQQILMRVNKNEDLNSPIGLAASKMQFVKFNGAISDRQLKWLDEVLAKSQKAGEVVLVAGHNPLHSWDVICLPWNYKEILGVLHKYSCVLAYFGGHSHDREYGQDYRGIHHLTFRGVIEVKPGAIGAHSNVTLYRDRVSVYNVDSCETKELLIKRN